MQMLQSTVHVLHTQHTHHLSGQEARAEFKCCSTARRWARRLQLTSDKSQRCQSEVPFTTDRNLSWQILFVIRSEIKCRIFLWLTDNLSRTFPLASWSGRAACSSLNPNERKEVNRWSAAQVSRLIMTEEMLWWEKLTYLIIFFLTVS